MLQLINLGKRYDTGDEALKNVNLEIPDGQIIGLIGPSGAGKSTLIRCVNRLVEPTTGKVILNGTDVTQLPSKGLRKARRKMGMIFRSKTYHARANSRAKNICRVVCPKCPAQRQTT